MLPVRPGLIARRGEEVSVGLGPERVVTAHVRQRTRTNPGRTFLLPRADRHSGKQSEYLSLSICPGRPRFRRVAPTVSARPPEGLRGVIRPSAGGSARSLQCRMHADLPSAWFAVAPGATLAGPIPWCETARDRPATPLA